MNAERMDGNIPENDDAGEVASVSDGEKEFSDIVNALKLLAADIKTPEESLRQSVLARISEEIGIESSD